MKKTIREFDKDGNLIKETIIEKEEEEKIEYIPYNPYDYEPQPNFPDYEPMWVQVGDNPCIEEMGSGTVDVEEENILYLLI